MTLNKSSVFSLLKTSVIAFIAFVAITSAGLLIWANTTWDNLNYEKIMTNINISPENFDILTFNQTLKYYLAGSIILFLIALALLNNRRLFLSSLGFGIIAIYNLHIIPYYYYQYSTSDLYENYYHVPTITAQDFPQKKRNLLLIYLESVEKNFASADLYDRNLLPQLSKLAQKNPHSDNYFSLYGTDYTKGALVSGHCGTPNKLPPIDTPLVNQFRNMTCLSDILANNGYETWFAKSADHSFAGTDIFYTNHNYQHIIDASVLTQGMDPKTIKQYESSYNGLSDKLLFTNLLSHFQKGDIKEPFLMTTFTVDTHFPGTVLPKNCPKIYGDMRDNILCTDDNVISFLNAFRQTPYWKNTTIVVLGDHLMFQELLHKSHVKRGIYNVFLNLPKTMTINPQKQFTAVDMAPTYLEAIGINLKDHTFGLGRSLFSEIPSLISIPDLDFKNEIKKKSPIANNFHQSPKKAEYLPYTPGVSLNNQTAPKYSAFSRQILNKNFIGSLFLKLPQKPTKDLSMSLTFEAMLNIEPKLTVKLNNKVLKIVNLKKKIGSQTVELIIPSSDLTSENISLEFINNNYRSSISQTIIILDFKLSEI